jgi:hypothetical protein
MGVHVHAGYSGTLRVLRRFALALGRGRRRVSRLVSLPSAPRLGALEREAGEVGGARVLGTAGALDGFKLACRIDFALEAVKERSAGAFGPGYGISGGPLRVGSETGAQIALARRKAGGHDDATPFGSRR